MDIKAIKVNKPKDDGAVAVQLVVDGTERSAIVYPDNINGGYHTAWADRPQQWLDEPGPYSERQLGQIADVACSAAEEAYL